MHTVICGGVVFFLTLLVFCVLELDPSKLYLQSHLLKWAQKSQGLQICLLTIIFQEILYHVQS